MGNGRPSAAPSESFAFSLVRFSSRLPPAWAIIAAATASISMAGLALRGLNDNGWRLASQLAWRFTILVYLLAIVAGPVGRLVSWQGLRALYHERRQFIWGFSASFAIFLATVLLPNVTFWAPVHGPTAGMLLFLVFGASLTAVIAYAAGPKAALATGEAARRALLGVGLCYFWLAYFLSGLSRLSGRPDIFHGVSATLLVAALLLRLADSVMARLRAGRRT